MTLLSTLRSSAGCQAVASRAPSTSLLRQSCFTQQRAAFHALFSETDNPELNSIFKHIQDKIIMPAHLPKKQRKLVFDQTKRSQLSQNPIVVEVAGVEHKFSTIDRFKDVQNSKKLLASALGKMQTTADWDNLGTLLAGYRKAGIVLQRNHWGKIARVAGEAGHYWPLIECAQRHDETGFTLSRPEVAVRLLVTINHKVSYRSTQLYCSSERAARVVFDMLHRPEHMARRSTSNAESLVFSRIVRGLTLYNRAMGCSTAIWFQPDNGAAHFQLLADEAQLYRKLWQGPMPERLTELREFANLNPAEERPSGRKVAKPHALNGFCYVQMLAQTVRGLVETQKFLGDGYHDLTPIKCALDRHAAEFAATAPSACDGWREEYQRVVGKKPGEVAEEAAKEAGEVAAPVTLTGPFEPYPELGEEFPLRVWRPRTRRRWPGDERELFSDEFEAWKRGELTFDDDEENPFRKK